MKKDALPLGWTVLSGGLVQAERNKIGLRRQTVALVGIDEEMDITEVAQVNELYVALQAHIMGEATQRRIGQQYIVSAQYGKRFRWHIDDMASEEFPNKSYEHRPLRNENQEVIGISFFNSCYQTDRGYPAVHIMYAEPEPREGMLRPSPVKSVIFDWVKI